MDNIKEKAVRNMQGCDNSQTDLIENGQHFLEAMNRIDFDELYREKLALQTTISLMTSLNKSKKDRVVSNLASWLTGLLGALDEIGDAAEKEGIFIYPKQREEGDQQQLVSGPFFDSYYNHIWAKKPIPFGRELTRDTFAGLETYEDTVAIRISGDKIVLRAMVEYWEEAADYGFADDPYRILLYPDGELWSFDKSEVAKHSLIDRIVEQGDYVAGGIYFEAESDRDGESINAILLNCLRGTDGYDSLRIVDVNEGEKAFSHYISDLADGLYIIRFHKNKDTLFTEKY